MQNGIWAEILSDIEAIAKDEDLFREKNFITRSTALDEIEFHVIDRLQSLSENADSSGHFNDLKQYAENVRGQLEEVNKQMHQKLRSQISIGRYRGKMLMNLMNEYFNQSLDSIHQLHETGYDHLDLFLNGLLTYRVPPAETKKREPGMVYYQKTPARIIFELIKKASFQPDDVFYDLGSGLGQVTMLVNLFASVISKGVEFEPAYCSYAKTTAADLNLNHVEFINADARHADYSSGTVFFMYTPFEGEILKDVLHCLYDESKKRKIRLFTYGSCSGEIAGQQWVEQVNEIKNQLTELAVFVSI